MIPKWIDSLFDGSTRPNKFTMGMGNLIRSAREEAGLSQRDLAEVIYRRQAALSAMENGKMEPDATTLLLLSYHLKKPIGYFYPDPFKPDKVFENLSDEIKELIIQAKRLDPEDLKRLIAQTRVIADLYGN